MNDVFQTKTHLHFGAIVYISSFQSDSNFYMFSNGIAFNSVISLAESEGPIDPAKCLFTVTPITKFQSESFLEKIVKGRYSEEHNLVEEDEKKVKVYIDQFEFELRQNNQIKEQQLKLPIKYGQNFMLQHKFSSKYLSFEKNSQNQYTLHLSEIPITSCIFNLGACYNYQKDINTYIPFNSAAFLSVKIHEGLHIRQMNLTFNPLSMFDPWVLVEEEWSKIQIGLYQPYEEIEYKNILYGDSVWIFHLESGSFVKVLTKEQVVESTILKKIKYSLGFMNDHQGMVEKNDAKILIQKAENEMSAEKFGLWKILPASSKGGNQRLNKKAEKFQGGRLKFDEEICFFNIRYHSFLSVRKIKKGKNKMGYEFSMEEKEEINTVFRIKNLSSSSLYVTTEDLFLIENVLTETYLTLSEPFALNETQAFLTPSVSYKKEDNFKFTKIDFHQEWQNNCILSIVPFLNEGIISMKKIDGESINEKDEVILRLMSENLMELLTFSYDLTEGFEASDSKLGKMTYNHFMIQKLLREQGVIRILIDILDLINPKLLLNRMGEEREAAKMQNILKIIKKYSVGLKSNERKSFEIDPKLIRKIVNSSFKVLRNCCKENYDNSQSLFGQINIFIKYLGLNTYAEDFFIDSFHNQFILHKIGTEQFKAIINQYIRVQEITKRRCEKMFILLQRMVSLENKGISKNQLEIFKTFFYLGNSLMIPIEHSEEGSFLVNGHELIAYCQENEEDALYLSSQIKFYGYLTIDRNYVCSKTIKKMFPLATVYKYFMKESNSDVEENLKESFLYIIINSYLNERPRFKEAHPQVFSMDGQDETNEESLPQFEAEIRMMRQQGMEQEYIDDIISCIHQEDTMNNKQLVELKEKVIAEIEKISENSSSHNFYSSKTESYMICLKYLIELSVFRKEESKKVEQLIERIAKEIASSLVVKGENNTKLESNNFRELLLEMVEKNVIQKYNFSLKYDGIEDEVNPENICSIFINYAFYQNILLEEKDNKKRKEADSSMKIMLELIGIYSRLIISEKFSIFHLEIIKKYEIERYSESKQKFVEDIIINRILSNKAEEKTEILSLLALLFYNSNTYIINYFTISRIIGEIFAERAAMHSISRVLFNVDHKENQEFSRISNGFKNIKLLIETSEIWLNLHQIQKSPTSKYDPIIMLFISKMRELIRIIMPGLREEDLEGSIFAGICAAHTISPEKQQIFSNLNFDREIFEFISSYQFVLNQIKFRKSRNYNRLLIPLFRTCFLFLFVFIYDCPENKAKLHRAIKENILKSYFNQLGEVDFGETMLIVEYLKNNYEGCIDFFAKNSDSLQKKFKYTLMHSQLLLTMMKFYDEPIQANLRKLFIAIFDFSSYKNFIWLRSDTNELNLDLILFKENEAQQPYFYQINCFEILIQIITYVEQSRNSIKNHIRKSLSQDYLYSLLNIDDFYTKDNSNKPILKVAILLKQKVMKILSLAYFSEEVRSDTLVYHELKKQNQLLNKLIEEAPARKENENFKRIIIMKEEDIYTDTDHRIEELYKSIWHYNWNGLHLLEIYLNEIMAFGKSYQKAIQHTDDSQLQRIGEGCIEIRKKIERVYEILYRMKKNEQEAINYPIPSQWLFNLPAMGKREEAMEKKRYTSAILIESAFNKAVYTKIEENQKSLIQIFFKTLDNINLKEFLFLQKLSEFLEDAFQKLANENSEDLSQNLKYLIRFMTLWIRSAEKKKVNQIRKEIGKSELIFPMLNYFEISPFDKSNKELFLYCLEFYNELLGSEGNPMIQTIFNQYFTNKADSIQFFMKIKQLFDEINFEDRANYKCKKIFEGMEALSRQCRLQKGPEFILLNFLICLCKGSFRDNQIFLSSLSNISNFNIMSGIWEILKYQAQKYKKNLINVENYHLITQCFSTIKELVEGPCAENQNEFLKRDFFLTVLDYFQFEATESDLTLEKTLSQKIEEMNRISPSFTKNLRIYLNQDKITLPWMPSQVKYRCINLIASLLAENVTKESKNQLYTLPVSLIVSELDRVYQRYVQLGLEYSYENLEVQEEKEVVLPLGYKLYELLQFYPKESVPKSSPGIDFFKENSRIVEVVHQKLCFVVFPHIPGQISSGFMKQFLENVDRTSVNSKLRGLQDAEIQNRQSDYPYGYLLFLLVLAVTVLDIIMYDNVSLPFVQFFKFYSLLIGYGWTRSLEIVLGLLQILIIVFSGIFLFLEVRGAVYFKEYTANLHQSDISLKDKIKRMLVFLWENLSYFHYLITLTLAILSLFNPFFDALLLIVELNRRSETFAATINAISSTLDQLLVVLLFMLIATYILTGIIYFHRASVDFPLECQTLYYCLVFSLDNGLRADAGLVGYTDDEDTILTTSQTAKFEDVLLNFIYLLIIKVIIDQIIGAIIVDRFVALRESKEKIEENENSFCFICGLERNLLDREEDGFEHHKEEYHNVWNYFEFLIYIRESKINNLSGIERFVFEQQKNGKLNWFPINRSLHLEMKNEENNEQKEEENLLEKVSKQLDGEVTGMEGEMGQIWELLSFYMAKERDNDSS